MLIFICYIWVLVGCLISTVYWQFLIGNIQGGHWSGKSQGNLIFLQGQGKVREFAKWSPGQF